MNTNFRALSQVRQRSPFATPPHILVLADTGDVNAAVRLAEQLDGYGADAEVRLDDDRSEWLGQADAVVYAERKGYRVARHHPVLEAVLGRR